MESHTASRLSLFIRNFSPILIEKGQLSFGYYLTPLAGRWEVRGKWECPPLRSWPLAVFVG